MEHKMKIDPYNHKERYLKWKEKAKESIPELSKENSDILMSYLSDMERGLNISVENIKGPRSFNRLNTIRQRFISFTKKFQELYSINKLTEINEEQLVSFFSDMRNGTIKREDGTNYKSVETPAKIFKAFWHWWMKVNRKKGIEIQDITIDLDTTQEKPDWVYLTEEQVKKLGDNAKYEYKVLMMFLFDTGIRAPTELMNIKVSDFFNDFKELNIRDEISKTFGRRIKLMICSQLIKEYVKARELKQDSYIFDICPKIVNKYLRRLAERILGDATSPAGQKFSELTMYDFRHISCCYWLPRYKSESALKYRFGWKKSDKIHYYSELLGMKDTIQEDDMLVDITRTEIEKELERTRKENSILQDKMKVLEEQMSKIVSVTDQLFGQIKRNAQKKETRDIELNLSEVSVMPLGKKPSRI